VQAMTVVPGRPETAGVADVPEPPDADGEVLVDGLLVGLCGTDREIAAQGYGWAPPGEPYLLLGHESLGRVVTAPAGCGLAPGDMVAGIVRRPDPEPCPCCATGSWDFCRNGRYTERGIKERHGYGARRWRVEPAFAVPVPAGLGDLGVLLEPASVVAKAWDQIDRIGGRACWDPRTVLVTGAGPIGLLAALLGAQRGLDVHVLDRATDGLKPGLATGLDATYHVDPAKAQAVRPDIVLECTGVGRLVFDVADSLAPNGIMCLLGVGGGGCDLVDLGDVNRTLVLGNGALFGSVNASRRDYELAARALAAADRSWLARLVTRRLPLTAWTEGLEKRGDDVKVVVDLAE
jgi:glucose 1-dehydrogenase